VILYAENLDRGSKIRSMDSLTDMIKYFGHNKLVTPDKSVCFISRLINNAIVDRLIAEIKGPTLLLEALATSALHVSSDKKSLSLFNASWSALSSKLGLHPTRNQNKDEEPVKVLIEGLMNSKYSNIICSIARECSDISRWKDDVKGMYHVGGLIAKNCSHLLYKTGGADPTFTNLIGNLLTPSCAFSSSWVLSGQQKQGIQLSLGNYIQGLLAFSKFENDRYIVRKVSEIIRIYLTKFDLKNHPLSLLLTDTTLQSKGEKVLELTLNTIKTMLKENRVKNPSHALSCLNFVKFSLDRASSKIFQLISEEIFVTLLEIITLTDDKTLKNPAISSLQTVVHHKSSESGLTTKHVFIQKMNRFVEDNLSFNSDRVFKTLQVVAVIDKEIISLVSIANEIKKTEKKRGISHDSKLHKLFAMLKRQVN